MIDCIRLGSSTASLPGVLEPVSWRVLFIAVVYDRGASSLSELERNLHETELEPDDSPKGCCDTRMSTCLGENLINVELLV